MPGISDLLDSDMEENKYIDENSIISSASDATDQIPVTQSRPAAKKPKKRSRVTMPKPKSRVAKSSPIATEKKPIKKSAATKRKELDDTAENHVIVESQQEESREIDTVEVEEVAKPDRKKRGRKPKRAIEEVEGEGMEVDQTPAVARSSHSQNTGAKGAPRVVKASKTSGKLVPEEVIVEVQTDPLNLALAPEEIDEIAIQQPPSKRARTESRTRQDSNLRRRAGSTSDIERGDPNLRRKLGDITRKFENIDMKYKNLKETGVSEANANFEKLRKQCEASTEASNNLISSLKKELALQTPLTQDARRLKKELQLREEELVKLRASQAELHASLGMAHNEIKALQAKLAAARMPSAPVETQPAKPPGSAMKVPRSVVAANAEANQMAQMAQMKLDLYGDLTGLIVRGVKHAEDGDTYDCIQTGRNGTLHFKLFIDQEDAKNATFEETEFLYTPLLDEDRDRDMIELMPPYLTEDITFARQNAAKFYQRVVDTLTRRTCET